MSTLEKIIETYQGEQIVTALGLDEAVIGIDEDSMRLIYSVAKVIEILQRDGMSKTDATEYFIFNIEGAYVGQCTPIWCQDDL